MRTVEEALVAAQRKAAELFAEVVVSGLIRAGALESELSKEIHALANGALVSAATGTSASCAAVRTPCSRITTSRLIGAWPRMTWCTLILARYSVSGKRTSDALTSWARMHASTGWFATLRRLLARANSASRRSGPDRGVVVRLCVRARYRRRLGIWRQDGRPSHRPLPAREQRRPSRTILHSPRQSFKSARARRDGRYAPLDSGNPFHRCRPRVWRILRGAVDNRSGLNELAIHSAFSACALLRCCRILLRSSLCPTAPAQPRA